MSTVLVTGASGWIGRYVMDEIGARGHDLIATSDRARPELGIHPLDVTDADAVTDVFAQLRPAAVINLAGLLGTEELLGREVAAVNTNILGAINVYDAARRIGARVVQIGTGHKGQPNTYAITKGAAHDLGLMRARELNEDIVIVRAFHAYGPGQAVPQPHGKAPYRKIVPSFVCRALTDMPIEIYGDGENVIDLVHVREVAVALADAVDKGDAGGEIEAGTGRGTTVIGAARDIIKACGSASKVTLLPPRPGEPVGAVVLASNPVCVSEWPYGLDDTIQFYADQIGVTR